ncbi:conserved hypothetical protein [Parafrankia sp. EAN1pec]|uniref:DUF1360 domain-containing protein n=1 Tax=Parafrankia sp. (strain EAN1pec) TaxID=298653 RepID=UPI000054137D|nr:conserved hypothetical protein [Frankia sp. EAN1pec]
MMMTALESTARQVVDRVTGVARREEAEYSGGEPRPLGGYRATLVTYDGVCASMVGVARLVGASPLRAPFTRYRGRSGPAELAEDVRESGEARHSTGDLLTCPFSAAQWEAALRR